MIVISAAVMISMFVNSAAAGIHEVLIKAAEHGELYSVYATIDNGADVNTRMDDGMTPLMHSSLAGHLKVVRVLLDKGADVNARTNHGVTSLMFSSLGGHSEIVRALIAKGADVNARMNDGKTVLMLASAGGSLEIVKILLLNGADVTVKNNDGLTAQVIASINGLRHIEKLLKEDPVVPQPGTAKPTVSESANNDSSSAALRPLATDNKKQGQKNVFYTLLAGKTVDRARLGILIKKLSASGLSPVVREEKNSRDVYRLVTECFNEQKAAQRNLTNLIRKEKQAFIAKDGEQHCVVASSCFSVEAARIEQAMFMKKNLLTEIVKVQVPLVSWEVTVGHFNDSQSAEVEMKRLAEMGINVAVTAFDK